jgi:hypothetical protein
MLTHPPSQGVAIVITSLRPRLLAFASALFAFLLLVGEVALGATPTKVLGTPRSEFDGTAENGYLAYTQSRAGQPNRFDAYLKAPGVAKVKVNAGGTQGYHTNLEMANPTFGNALVFVQKGGGDADIKIWDVASGGRSNPPVGVNTQASEAKPSLDGNHLLFGRGPANRLFIARVILFDLTSNTSVVVDTAPTNGIVYPGIVNGDWATWTECSQSDCRAWRYQISTATKTEVPSSARLIYTSAIDTVGTVWFVQSGIGCGANVKIRRHVIGVGSSTLVDFPPGVDANISDLDDSGATHRLYFARVNCANVNNWNIYRVAADA